MEDNRTRRRRCARTETKRCECPERTLRFRLEVRVRRSAFRTSSGGPRNEEDDNNNNNNKKKKKKKKSFLLATGSSNGEVFVWAVSGKRRKNEASSERVLAKFNANAGAEQRIDEGKQRRRRRR